MRTASRVSVNPSQVYSGKRVVVSGAGGYLGSAVAARFHDLGSCLRLSLHRAPANPPLPDSVEMARVGDVSQATVWEELLPDADYLFHLAAHEHRHGAADEPLLDLQTNAVAVLTLLEVCRTRNHRPVIVFSSSINIVGCPGRASVDEQSVDDPLTLFSIHKLTAEHYLAHYSKEHRIRSVALRLPNVFGPTPARENATRVALNAIIQGAIEKGRIRLMANHSCVRDYLFIDDAVSAFLLAGVAAVSNPGERFVIGSGESLTMAQTAELIADRVESKIGRRPVIKIDASVPLERLEWRSFKADSSRFSALTGWKPRVPLSTAIDRTIDFFIGSGTATE